MELTSILLLVLMMLLGYRMWLWWKKYGSFRQIFDQLRYRIRSGLRVVDVEDLEAVQENLFRLEQQVYARLVHLKTAEKVLPQVQKCPEEFDPPFVQPVQTGDFLALMDVPSPRPRSIMWNGLRFTLSDSIWANLGVIPRDDLENGQVQAMVQGPFCQFCLKRLVGRNPVLAVEVPVQCRYCGLSWSNQGSESQPILLIDLKRQVYDNLDREFRRSRRAQC